MSIPSFPFFSNASSKPNLNYAALSFPHSTSNGVPNNMADYRGNSVYSAGTTYTQFTTVSMTPTGGKLCTDFPKIF